MNGNDEYGDSSEGPEGLSPWSIKFEDTIPEYDELLLSSVNCKHWMIIDKENIHFGKMILALKIEFHMHTTNINIDSLN